MNLVKNLLFKNLAFKFSKLTSGINLKPTEFVFSQDTKALCLCPHADDESIGMAGVLCKFNKNFNVVLLTDGRKGVKELSVDEVIKLREDEFSSAMKVADIQGFSFLRIKDKHLIDEYEKFKTIEIANYDYIFLPNIIDQHPDHKAVSLLLNKLLDEKKHKPNLKICFYEVWSTLALTNSYIDISDIHEKKREMLNCYKSQIATKDYEYYALGLNAYRGMFKDKKFVEAFCVLEVKDFQNICKLY